MRRPARLLAVAAAGLAGATALAGCGGSSSGGSAASSSSTASASSSASLSGTITVLAAASLTEAFTTLGQQFQTAHPGTTVKFSFGASSTLAQQIIQGAPADVFASASTKNMTQVAAQQAGPATTFANNTMEIAVTPGNPKQIMTVADLAKPGTKVVICAAAVPCGVGAAGVFKNAGVTVKPVSLEQDVKSTLTKVETKEADAGIVYVTDVRSAGSKVQGVTIPAGQNFSTAYPIDTLKASQNPTLAAAFQAYVLSADGQKVLTADGFAQP